MEKILMSIVPKSFAKANCIYPLNIDDKTIYVEMDRYELNVVNELKIRSNRRVSYIKEDREVIYRKIEENYPDDEKEVYEGDSGIKRMIINAVDMQASDIHIEAQSMSFRIRFRIYGQLMFQERIAEKEYNEIITLIKLKSGCDITEKRLPQDGRFSFRYGTYDIDIRVSTIPTLYGEKMVLRLLDRNHYLKTKKELGFLDDAIVQIDEMISEKRGMLIISGATGSGKSSTVYSILKEMSDKNINITTIEDPVEYSMDGINQIQVNQKAGITFDNGLRAILRQDPDVIVVGEIRDCETAEIAVRAAITGHLVISTLHTSDAFSTIDRLRDMGIETYLINASLSGIISQKLVKNSFVKNEREGRTLIYEVLRLNEEIKMAIKNNVDISVLKKIALSNDMITFEKCIKEKKENEHI